VEGRGELEAAAEQGQGFPQGAGGKEA
jgi:hypothetical protein